VEIMMDMLDAVMIAGICIAVGAGVFLLSTQWQIAKRAGGQDVHLDSTRRGERLDLYMGVVWSGLLLVQVTNVLHHMQHDGTLRLSLLSLAAAAGAVFVCGAFAGRLLLRREMRLGEEKRRNEMALR
jgi:hypothetical protein